MAAPRTLADFNGTRRSKKLFASNAQKRGPSPFTLIPQMIAAIIKMSQSKYSSRENSTKDQCRSVQFKHNFKRGYTEYSAGTSELVVKSRND